MGLSISRATGARLPDELADIAQSIQTIVTTPVGSRLRRRTFGSHVFDLIDSPAHEAGALRLIAAAADPVERWDRRVSVLAGRLAPRYDGGARLTLDVALRLSGRPLTVDVPLVGVTTA
jgi:phage baseplate assembly protein W